MHSQRLFATLISLALIVGASSAASPAQDPTTTLTATPDEDDARIRSLLERLKQILENGQPADYLVLLTSAADHDRGAEFAEGEIRPGTTRVVVAERDRTRLFNPQRGQGYRLMVDAFIESGRRARISSWQFDLWRDTDGEWRIGSQQRLSNVESLYRLSVDRTRQYDALNFKITAEDLDLTLVDGSVFEIDTDQGTTGLVLMGRGEMRFRPTPETERGQVRLFAGSETLETRFEIAYLRVGNLGAHADLTQLTPRAVDARDLRRAEEVFEEESAQTYTIDAGDLSADTWSLMPGNEDFLAEIRTRRFGALTYARSLSEAEDVSLLDRRGQRHIAVYASAQKLAERGPLFTEDDFTDYDVLDYDIDLLAAPTPQRQWLEGRATLRLRVRSPLVTQLRLRLADSLDVESVVSVEYGRLFSFRLINQNTLLVSLPLALMQDTEFGITVAYRGFLAPQPPDREALALAQSEGDLPPSRGAANTRDLFARLEETYLYSSRTDWYPQPAITDYATATLKITVPANLGCVASGESASDSPVTIPTRNRVPALKVYTFNATRPVRYLAFIVGRLLPAEHATVEFDEPPHGAAPADAETAIAGGYDALDVSVESQPLQAYRSHDLLVRAMDIARYYQGLLGDSPYPTFTIALIESALPGGHSPAYFAALNQPAPDALLSWRNDPAYFDGFPEFFVAHELAHQWWGQAVGWRNYHEQWLSEGFSQYFAALYAADRRGDEVFASILKQFRRWALSESDQGPVYLGSRAGHIRNDSRVFRALVYNKGAAVLHMLRRLIGDEAFFRGLRRFYRESRYEKVGTDDFRLVMEAESGRSLERFFERWIYGSSLPQVRFTYRVEPLRDGREQAVLRFEQQGDLFDFPASVVLQYADRRSVEVMVPVTERVVERTVPLEGRLRSVTIRDDDGTIADFKKN